MKIILSIIAASCIVVCTKALSCYQCQDVAMEYDSDVTNEMMNDGDGGTDDQPRCDSNHMTPCPDDGGSYDMCGAISISYGLSIFGVSMKAELAQRMCLPFVDSNNQAALEEVYCNAMEKAMTGSSEAAFDFTSCKLDVCSTDNCNTQGMEKFQDDGEEYDGDKDNYDYESSGSKLTISFLLIQLVSFLAVTVL